MRLSTSFLTTLTRACSLAVLCLLCANIASAVPAHHHRRATARVCDPQATTLKKLAAHQTRGGPVASPSTRALAGLVDPVSHVRRAKTTVVDDDVAAIQNDAPAGDVDTRLAAAPVLHPLGLLARHIDRLPKLDAFSRWSPRGPPYSA